MSLTLTQAIQLAPSIGAMVPAEHVSADYRFVPTAKFLESFIDNGWNIASVKQVRARKRDPSVGKHLVRLYHRDFGFSKPELGEIRPELNIINSHDWSSRLSINLGLFRLVCTNGMVAGVTWDSINIRHNANIDMTVQDISDQFRNNAAKLIEAATNWKAIELSPEQIRDFTTEAVRIRFGDDYVPGRETPNISRRIADDGTDLWSTYNRNQENIIRGGYNFSGTRRARQLRNIDAERNINMALWDLANDFANRLN